jgi:predicted small secreted protein
MEPVSEQPMKTFIALILLAAFAGSMAACNTVEGFGKDTQKAGEKIEDAADRNK